MAEIEYRPDPRFEEVLLYHVSLHADRPVDDVLHRLRQAGHDAFALVAEKRKELLIAEQGCLDDLRKSAHELPLRQAFHAFGVDPERRGRIEGAHHIFVAAVVHARLPAECSIDHGKQRGRQKLELHASQIHGRGKGGDVGYHAAAHPDEHRVAAELTSEGLVYDELHRGPLFGMLAGGKHKPVPA